MMNGRLRRGWVVEYCAGAVDVIPLFPPLNASREPAHNHRNVIVTGDKKERRTEQWENWRGAMAGTGHVRFLSDDSSLTICNTSLTRLSAKPRYAKDAWNAISVMGGLLTLTKTAPNRLAFGWAWLAGVCSNVTRLAGEPLLSR